MSSTVAEVVVGATKKKLVGVVLDENGNAVNITGSTIKLQGRSATLTAITIDAACTITDASNGVYEVVLGTLVATGDLATASLAEAVFRLRVKQTDSGGKIDYSEAFDIKWTQLPTVLV